MSHTTTWQVEGMTCEHCVASVTEEIGELSGVSDVEVTLDSGQVVVTSTDELTREAIASAVDEAGYRLV